MGTNLFDENSYERALITLLLRLMAGEIKINDIKM